MELRTLVVFNPKANRGTVGRLLPELERCLALHGQADLIQTTRQGEAGELATHLDGEIFAEAARWLDIEVLPRRLTVIA